MFRVGACGLEGHRSENVLQPGADVESDVNPDVDVSDEVPRSETNKAKVAKPA